MVGVASVVVVVDSQTHSVHGVASQAECPSAHISVQSMW